MHVARMYVVTWRLMLLYLLAKNTSLTARSKRKSIPPTPPPPPFFASMLLVIFPNSFFLKVADSLRIFVM